MSMSQEAKYRGAVFLFCIGVALLITAMVLGIIATWTHGPEAGRIGGTAAILGVPGLILALSSSFSVFGI